jgi:predicted RNase H-like nuclease (RuvC/YqgF family)
MDTAAIVSIIGALVALGSLYVQLRRLKPDTKVSESQADVNKSETAKNITDAAQTALSVLKEALEFSERERQEERTSTNDIVKSATDAMLKASARNNELEDSIAELKRRLDEQEIKTADYRHERETMIETMSVKLEEQGKQILAFENRVAEMKEKYNKAIELLVGLLDPDKRDVALQELSHILGDSVYKFKLPRSGGKK